MTRWYVIAAALLGAVGCEQWKAPQRIKELEGKVEELSEEVATLKGGSGAARKKPKKKPDAHGDAHGDGSGEAKPTDEHGEAKPVSEEHAGDSHAESAGSGSGSGDGEGDWNGESADKPADEAVAAAAKHGDEHGAPDEAKESAKEAKDEKPDEHAKAEPGTEAKPDEHGKGTKDAESKPDEHAKAEDGEKPAEEKPALSAAARAKAEQSKETQRAFDELSAVVAKATGGQDGKKPGEPNWSYEGKLGPAAWGKLDPAWRACGTGKAQSPIDIEPRASSATPITFHYKPTVASLVDTGRTLQVNLDLGSSIDIGGRPYDLVQFHFHTPSEHSIAGEHYPLEVHLLHKSGSGKLAVISVLYDAGTESKPLAAIWSAWPKKIGTTEKLRKPFDPTVLLPETRTAFRYIGSLTTPPCTEGVLWNVMRRTKTDGQAQIDAFRRHYALNARDVQPRNDRKIE